MDEKLMPMVDYILDIDWLTTSEFCKKYNVPLPRMMSTMNATVDSFLQIDAIKHRMFVEHAKKLNKERLKTIKDGND